MRSDILQQAQAIRAATLKAAAHVAGDNDRLGIRVLYPEWTPGAHAVGDLYNAAGQTWECCTAYDNAVYPDIVPGNGAWHSFNRPLHGTAPDTARPFVPPVGAHDMYKAGEYMTLDDRLYRCLMDTVYAPAEYAPAWEAMA